MSLKRALAFFMVSIGRDGNLGAGGHMIGVIEYSITQLAAFLESYFLSFPGEYRVLT